MKPAEYRVRGNSGDKLWFYWNAATIHVPGCGISWELHDWNTMGQFIGLWDRKGRKIYEDDIVRIGDFTEVVKCTYQHQYVDYNDGQPKSYKGSVVGFFLSGMDHACEVIGNIHENPELLRAQR